MTKTIRDWDEASLSRETVAFTVTLRGRCAIDPEWGWVAEDVPAGLITPKGLGVSTRAIALCNSLDEFPEPFEETLGGTFDFYYPWKKADRRKKQLGWKITSRGRTYGVGRIVVTTKILRPTKTTTIWEGTDAFINVCINGLERLWSSGGRLYCESATPGVARVTVRLR